MKTIGNIEIVDPKEYLYGKCLNCGYPLPPPSAASHQCPVTTFAKTTACAGTLTFTSWFLATFLLALALSGCGVDRWLGNTTASYEITPTGPKVFFNSNKDQQGFKADVEVDEQGRIKKFHVSTTATTPETAIAAALQSNLKFQEQFGDILKAVIPMIEQAATKGAVAPKIGGSNAQPNPNPQPGPGGGVVTPNQ